MRWTVGLLLALAVGCGGTVDTSGPVAPSIKAGTYALTSANVANPPAPWAWFRVFRPEQGPRRLYYFTPGETRAPDGAELERQLRRAEYLSSGPAHQPAADPR